MKAETDNRYDVFISCKSEDYKNGKRIHDFLSKNGVKSFISCCERHNMPKDEYLKVISETLEKSDNLILYTSSKEYPNTEFVRFEWSSFLNEILSGRKSGNIITILKDVKVADLPFALRGRESFEYKKYQEGYKVVYAKRKTREGETWFKKATAKLFYRFLAAMTSIEIPVDVGDFRLIDKVIVNHLRNMPEKSKYIRGQISWIGYKQTFVEYHRDARLYGKTNYPLKKMLRLAFDGITAFSDKPLKMASAIGIISAILSLLAIIYALISYFIFDSAVSGWTSLIISVLFIGGVQLITIGIIGEYIARINNDVRNRPLYIIEEENIENQENNKQ